MDDLVESMIFKYLMIQLFLVFIVTNVEYSMSFILKG